MSNCVIPTCECNDKEERQYHWKTNLINLVFKRLICQVKRYTLMNEDDGIDITHTAVNGKVR